MGNEKRLRLLGLVGSTGQAVQLASPLQSQIIGFADTIVLNTPYLMFADGIILGSSSGAGVASSPVIGPFRGMPGSPEWRPGPINLSSTGTPPILPDQYLPVVVDPSTGNTEEVWITGLIGTTSFTSTWSCVRGVGSSIGAPAHNSTAFVVNAPTPTDVLTSYDTPWGGNLGFDYEFPGDSTGQLPAYTFNGNSYRWQWYNQGASSYVENWGAGVMSVPGSGSVAVRGIYMPVLPTPPFTVVAKLEASAQSNSHMKYGLMVTNGTGVYAVEGWSAGTSDYAVEYYANSTTFTTTEFTGANFMMPMRYFKLTYVSTSSITSSVSTDGRNWLILATTTMAFTPTGVGIMADSESGFPVVVSCEFFRVR